VNPTSTISTVPLGSCVSSEAYPNQAEPAMPDPRRTGLLVLVGLIAMAGCGPRPVDASGTWEGRWTAADGQGSGTFRVEVTQRGRTISGPIELSLDWLPSARITGSVEARRVRWGVLRGGIVVLSFEGEVDGDRAQGRYTIAAGGGGTWSAARIRRR
jgi:hypothetical protein